MIEKIERFWKKMIEKKFFFEKMIKKKIFFEKIDW